MKGLDRRILLQRIPEAEGAAGKAAIALGEAVSEPLVLALDLEGRVDEDQATLFLRRQVSAERQPAIEFGDPALEVAIEEPVQCLVIIRVQLHRRQTVLRAKKHADELRRTGIARQLRTGVELANGRQIRFEDGGDRRRQVAREQPADAVAPLAGLLRLFARQIIKADTGMGVENPERLLLLLEIGDEPGEHRMLENIGEIACVVDVPIVHEGRRWL
ncbi:hypothetical protein D3C72_1381860 [compost metagenome]